MGQLLTECVKLFFDCRYGYFIPLFLISIAAKYAQERRPSLKTLDWNITDIGMYEWHIPLTT